MSPNRETEASVGQALLDQMATMLKNHEREIAGNGKLGLLGILNVIVLIGTVVSVLWGISTLGSIGQKAQQAVNDSWTVNQMAYYATTCERMNTEIKFKAPNVYQIHADVKGVQF